MKQMDRLKFMREKESSRNLEPLENKGFFEQESDKREADSSAYQVMSGFNSATLRFVSLRQKCGNRPLDDRE